MRVPCQPDFRAGDERVPGRTGLVIIVSQIPKLLGLSGAPSSFFKRMSFILQNLPETNFYALVTWHRGHSLFFTLEHKFPRLSGSLFVVILSIHPCRMDGSRRKRSGDCRYYPTGTPPVGYSGLFHPVDVEFVFPLAVGLFVLSFVE